MSEAEYRARCLRFAALWLHGSGSIPDPELLPDAGLLPELMAACSFPDAVELLEAVNDSQPCMNSDQVNG